MTPVFLLDPGVEEALKEEGERVEKMGEAFRRAAIVGRGLGLRGADPRHGSPRKGSPVLSR